MQNLRPFQKQALQALLSPKNRHVICVSPTGSGKTRIIEEWVRKTKKKTLFISPLLALNRQQQQRFQDKKLNQWIDIKTPESLFGLDFRSDVLVYDQVVVDECHTVFEWGETFRPKLRELPSLFANKKTLWLTATLTQKHSEKLIGELGVHTELIGEFSFSKSISIQTLSIPWSARLEFIRMMSEEYLRLGVIFCNSREWCERIQSYLKARGLNVIYYHAGLSKEERAIVERKVQNGEVSLLVSTIAFGLGMHVPEIKWGMSWGFPGSFLSLSQMIGRVGRSDEGGRFYFLWSHEDELVWRRKNGKTESSQNDYVRLISGLKKKISLKEIIESEFRFVQKQ
ncbi:MAG: ATP-dependent DNA helicase RecQ [Xanthomonadaceae bacterium]|nr:ATP-dependent DNA helicase RecQ [Xanthomonadaceae bacterium]